eukprot:9498424-Pyramimonas_sp.AAC.1
MSRKCRSWEASSGLAPELPASQARSPDDTVWRQSARAELAASGKTHDKALLWDLKSLYETLDHAIIHDHAHQANYPIDVV